MDVFLIDWETKDNWEQQARLQEPRDDLRNENSELLNDQERDPTRQKDHSIVWRSIFITNEFNEL